MFNNTFSKDIEKLIHTSVTDLEEMILNNEEVTVFVGRASCPYCQKFAKKLANIEEKMYFINSEEVSDELQKFREKYNIVTVPGFLHANDGKVNVRCDSSMSIEEIKAMIAN